MHPCVSACSILDRESNSHTLNKANFEETSAIPSSHANMDQGPVMLLFLLTVRQHPMQYWAGRSISSRKLNSTTLYTTQDEGAPSPSQPRMCKSIGPRRCALWYRVFILYTILRIEHLSIGGETKWSRSNNQFRNFTWSTIESVYQGKLSRSPTME